MPLTKTHNKEAEIIAFVTNKHTTYNK